MSVLNHIKAITNLADQAVLLPLSAAVAVTLSFQWKRGAIAWVVGILLTFFTIIVSKLICYMVIGYWPFNIGLRSPSGHAAAGAVVYGSLISLIICQGNNGVITAFLSSCIVALFFSATRLELGVHTRSEVIVGSLIGILGAVTVAKLAATKQCQFSPIPLLVVTLTIIACTYGSMLHSEQVIAAMSYKIKIALRGRFQ